MSGHSKWSTIKHKKARTDSRRSKAFSRLSKEIILAAKLGGKDIDANPRLRTAVSAAKAVNVPNDNIDRALKRGTGEVEGVVYEEKLFAGYYGGVAILVGAVTDNNNRTTADVRHVFNKYNGKMVDTGSAAIYFEHKGLITLDESAAGEDAVMEVVGAGMTMKHEWLPEQRFESFLRRDNWVHGNETLRGAIAAANELKPHNLSDAEVADLVSFLKGLTDEESATPLDLIPTRVPSGLPVAD